MNTMETYRKINQWTSHSRDMVESFKRYYNNSFLDGQRQEAYNLFLGNYVFVQGQPMLWDLSTDYYLHHVDPRAWFAQKRRSYIQWFTPSHLDRQEMPEAPHCATSERTLGFHDNYWWEYYRPLAISSFIKIFSFRMNSTLKYMPFKITQEGKHDLSPFKVRLGHDHEATEKPRFRKGVTILDPHSQQASDSSMKEPITLVSAENVLPKWIHPHLSGSLHTQHSILKDSSNMTPKTPKTVTQNHLKDGKDKSAQAQLTLNHFVVNSLNPSVSTNEMDEYSRYISHPLNLPLVVSSEAPRSLNFEFPAYIDSASSEKVQSLHSAEEDINDYQDYLRVEDDPLTVTEADTPKKRYKAYRQWLKGKSLFKQQRVEP